MRIAIIAGLLILVLSLVALHASRDALAPAAPLPEDAAWETYANDAVTFRYPPTFPATYIEAVAWPPSVTTAEGSFACKAGTSERGETRVITVRGRVYCLSTTSEGAAGSVFTEYAYLTEKSGRIISVVFTLRMTQCGNYDEPQKAACEQERTSFNVDDLVDRILETVDRT